MKKSDNPTPESLDKVETVEKIEKIETIEKVEEIEEVEAPQPPEEEKLYTEAQLQQSIQEAYLRGRNEQIESQFVPDTSRLAERDGAIPAPQNRSDAMDASWIHTRNSVWG